MNDSSGLHNNIVFNNATKTTDRFGNSNNAYLFDGVSSYMQIKNSTSLNPDSITLFAILKVNGFYAGPCGGNAIITKGDDYAANGFYGMNFLDPTSNCGATNFNNEYFAGSYGNDIPIGSDAFLFADTVLVKTSTWYYITYTYDRGTAKMYINGQLKNTRQIAVGFNQNPFDLFLGKVNNVSFPYYFKGVIDEIRIYNRALCSGAVTQLNNVKE